MSATRKEKSKEAARKRRSDENKQFQELTQFLSFSEARTDQLHKVSVIRLIMSFLQYKKATGRDCKYNVESPKFNFEEALNGFIILLGSGMKILFVSPSVFQHLEIPQVDMIGTNILDYIHHDDQIEFENKFRQVFDYHCEMDGKFRHVLFTFRMRCIWNSKVRTGKMSHKFKVVQISGCLVPPGQTHTHSENENIPFTAFVQPLPSAVSLCELPLNSNAFVLKCEMDYKILSCEEKFIQQYFDYSEKDMIGRCYYDFIHPEDVLIVQTAHQDFLRTGKSRSTVYRLLNKCGGWAHLVTVATTLRKQNSKCKEHFEMLCINYIHSGIETSGFIEHQYPKRIKRRALKKEENESKDDNQLKRNSNIHKSQIKTNDQEMALTSYGKETSVNLDELEIPVNLDDLEIPVNHNSQEISMNSNDIESLTEIKMNTKVDTPLFSNMSNIQIDETPTLSPTCSTLSTGENDISVAMTEKDNILDCRGLADNISDGQETKSVMNLKNDSAGKSLRWFDSVFTDNEGFSLPEITYSDILSTLGPSSSRNPTPEYHHKNKYDIDNSISINTSSKHPIGSRMKGCIYPN